MSRIKSRDTKPEKLVRSLLFKMGYRFRKNKKGLPCNPDIVMPKYKVIIFVHGCFWHRHFGCQYAYNPKTNQEKWAEKFSQNVKRDKKNTEALEKLGWKVITIWECETKNQKKLEALLSYFISGSVMNSLREDATKYEANFRNY